MPILDFKCDKCHIEKELLVGSHIVNDSDDYKCSCGGTFQKLFTPSSIPSDVLGGYDYAYGRKSGMTNQTHKANYLADDNVSPY